MSSEFDNKETKSNVIFTSFHFMIALIFFLVILVNTIYLTKAVLGMSVNSSDTNAVKAKNLMLSACVISYTGDLLILTLLGIVYSYYSYHPNEANEYTKRSIKTVGGHDIYSVLRIIIFSLLMFVSLIVGSLCLEASKYINKSDDPGQYNNEYSLCKELGQMFILHFLTFTLLQGAVCGYQLFYNTGHDKLVPETVIMG